MPRKNLLVVAVWLVLSVACGSGDDSVPSTVPSDTSTSVGEDGGTPTSNPGSGSEPEEGTAGTAATTATGEGAQDGAGTTATAAATTTATTTGDGGSTEPDGTDATTTTGTSEPTDTPVTDDPSPTTTLYAGPVSPVSGLPVLDPSRLDRKLIAVKVDNHWNSRPQSGIEHADAVFELVVEAGITRFIALFHHSDSDWVGPVRSLRPTDWTLVKPLNGALTISGGQPWIVDGALSNRVPLIGDMGPPLTARWSDRQAPHNLYADTAEARRIAEDRGLDQSPPPTLFNRGPSSASPMDVATYIFLDWTDTTDVVWHWDGDQYLRSVEGVPHQWIDQGGGTGQIAADVLVVLMAERRTACPSGDGSCVPAWRTTGENRAVVFADGLAQVGRWSRADNGDWFTLVGTGGEPVTMPAGRTWIMIYPETAELVW
ncbi:MAG: DUF3048 domain-containing protein [Acidimicrobiia bacterium]|nr:DUF3048 domain-containing protein [Acidimicrobiia bacterium]